MVKGSPRIVVDARNEAASRTLAISQKMVEGTPIVPIVSADGKYQAQFDSERMIHGKIREYTLRSAAHWDQVNKTVSPSAAVAQAAPSNHQQKQVISADDFLMIAQMLPDNTFRALGFPAIQKGLREHVVAHLLRSSIDSSSVSLHARSSSRVHVVNAKAVSNSMYENQRAGSPCTDSHRISSKMSNHTNTGSLIKALLDSQLLRNGGQSSVSRLDDQSQKHSKHSLGLNESWSKFSGYQSSRSSDQLSALLCLLISSGALASFNVCFSSHAMRKRVIDNDSISKVVSFAQSSHGLGTSRQEFAMKDVNGFGTAPIWYQQSMAAGPPRSHSSLEPNKEKPSLPDSWWKVGQ